jgi:hypothetical protein
MLAPFWLYKIVMKTTIIKNILFILIPALTLTAFLSGCGGGGGQDPSADSLPAAEPASYFSATTDTYGLQTPTFLYTSDNSLGLVMRAEIVSTEQEMWFDTNVFRIDCLDGIAPGTYDLTETDSVCAVTIFNGFISTRLEAVGGSLTVDESGEWFTGTFEVLFADNYFPDSPLHWFSAVFSAPVGYGEAPDLSLPAFPADAEILFTENCLGCHNVVELSRSGGLLAEIIEADSKHESVLLTPEEIYSLKVLLNSTSSSEDTVLPL